MNYMFLIPAVVVTFITVGLCSAYIYKQKRQPKVKVYSGPEIIQAIRDKSKKLEKVGQSTKLYVSNYRDYSLAMNTIFISPTLRLKNAFEPRNANSHYLVIFYKAI